jgi:hypothetical protein
VRVLALEEVRHMFTTRRPARAEDTATVRARRFTAPQIVAIVLAVGAAAAIANPSVVRAATGSLTNIADPNNSAALAHVSADGMLGVGGTVDARPAIPLHEWHKHAILGAGDDGYGFNTKSFPLVRVLPGYSATLSSVVMTAWHDSGKRFIWIGTFPAASDNTCTLTTANKTAMYSDRVVALAGPASPDQATATVNFAPVPLTFNAPTASGLCLAATIEQPAGGLQTEVTFNGQVGDRGAAFAPAPIGK